MLDNARGQTKTSRLRIMKSQRRNYADGVKAVRGNVEVQTASNSFVQQSHNLLLDLARVKLAFPSTGEATAIVEEE